MDVRQHREIERLYFELFTQMKHYARSALDNDALAEEAVQETFRIACMKPQELCGSSNPQGWLFNTLKNVIQNTRKIRNRTNNLMSVCMVYWEAMGECSEDAVDPDLLYEDIAETEEYKLVKAFALERKSLLELAQERDISVAACKKRLERARKTLKQKIKLY